MYNNPDFFTKAKRACAVWVLAKLSFGGQISASFGFDKNKSTVPRKIAFAKENFNADLRTRLEHTTIECDDALRIIERYDIVYAFHFVDPPCIGSECGHYAGMFNEQNLRDLLDLLGKIKGKFILTMYPNDLIEAAANAHGGLSTA